jgi:hypothetical protein
VPDTGNGWTARRFFATLTRLGRLRIISQCGPSTFETLCRVEHFTLAQGFVNVISEDYHWHLLIDGFGHLRSRDEVHKRSGRRVVFFELRRDDEAEPFLLIYLYRGTAQEFGEEPLRLFAEMHRDLAAGAHLEGEAA